VNPNHKEINVKNDLENPNSVFNFYRQLLAFRKGNADLIYGDYKDIAPNHPEIFAYTRTGKNSTYLVVLNMSGKKVKFNAGAKFSNYQLVLDNQGEKNTSLHSTILTLAPWEAIIYKSK
jgi:glycosidase